MVLGGAQRGGAANFAGAGKRAGELSSADLQRSSFYLGSVRWSAPKRCETEALRGSDHVGAGDSTSYTCAPRLARRNLQRCICGFSPV